MYARRAGLLPATGMGVRTAHSCSAPAHPSAYVSGNKPCRPQNVSRPGWHSRFPSAARQLLVLLAFLPRVPHWCQEADTRSSRGDLLLRKPPASAAPVRLGSDGKYPLPQPGITTGGSSDIFRELQKTGPLRTREKFVARSGPRCFPPAVFRRENSNAARRRCPCSVGWTCNGCYSWNSRRGDFPSRWCCALQQDLRRSQVPDLIRGDQIATLISCGGLKGDVDDLVLDLIRVVKQR